MSGMAAAPSAFNSSVVMASTQPCMCACMCAWPRAASGTCSQQPGKAPPNWYQVRGAGHRAVSTQRPTPSSSVLGSSGKIRGVVMWKEEWACWSLSCAYCRKCGLTRAYLGRRSCPTSTPGRERSCVLQQPPKPWSVIQFALPTHQHHKPREATATVNQAAGQWAAGPGQWAGLDLL